MLYGDLLDLHALLDGASGGAQGTRRPRRRLRGYRHTLAGTAATHRLLRGEPMIRLLQDAGLLHLIRELNR